MIKAAFVDHYATQGPTQEELLRHMFLAAKEAGCAVIFCLGSLAPAEAYLSLGMEASSGLGDTYYTFYNFACPFIQPKDVGLIFWD